MAMPIKISQQSAVVEIFHWKLTTSRWFHPLGTMHVPTKIKAMQFLPADWTCSHPYSHAASMANKNECASPKWKQELSDSYKVLLIINSEANSHQLSDTNKVYERPPWFQKQTLMSLDSSHQLFVHWHLKYNPKYWCSTFSVINMF